MSYHLHMYKGFDSHAHYTNVLCFFLSCTIDLDIHEFLKKDENRTIEKMKGTFRHILR